MRMRFLFTSSAVLASLLATTSLQSRPAWAQKGVSLAPITQWAVTRVDGAAEQGGGYCAVARRFRQNAILTMARNMNEEASVALDFQAPKLSAGENMRITFDPGGGEQRYYDIAPVSDRAFVVRLGRDEKFFDALRETGHLRIVAGEGSYNFNLSDIDSGQSKLDTCLASLAEPAAGASDNAGGIQDEVASLRQDVRRLREQNDRLSDVVRKSDNLLPMNDADAHDETIAGELASSARRLEGENEVLRRQAEATGVSAGSAAAGAGTLSDLQTQNRRLQDALFSMKLKGADVNGMRDKIAGMVRQNASIRAHAARSPRPEGWAQAEAEAFSLREENRRLQSVLERESGGFQLAQSLQQQVDILQGENKKLQEEIKSDPVQEDAQKKIVEITAQLAEKDKKLVEMSALAAEAEALKARNAELERKLSKNSGNPEQIGQLNQRVKTLEEENAKMAEQIRRATAGGGEAEKIAALTRENEELKKEIESLKRSAQDSGALSAELVKLREENIGLKKEVAALEKELAEARKKSSPVKAEARDVNPNPQAQAPQEQTKAADITALPAATKSLQVSEAQMQEQAMRQSLKAPPPVPERPAASLEAHISEDPYAPMPPQEELQAVEAKPGLQEDEIIETVDITAPDARVSTREEIKWNQAAAGMNEQGSYYSPAFSVREAVGRAEIASASQVRMIEQASNLQRLALQWKSGDVFGSAEQIPLARLTGFDAGVEEYLDKTRGRCPGDFAAEPDSSIRIPGARAAGYEIACVGKGVNSSAALLFVDKEGAFTVIAHEAPTDSMDDAMELRDRLVKAISGT